jgi:hypothetical protein
MLWSQPLRRSPEFTTYSNEAKLLSERSNTISNDSAGPALHPAVAPRLDYGEGPSAGNKLVNGFVNETPRNDCDGVKRSVTA